MGPKALAGWAMVRVRVWGRLAPPLAAAALASLPLAATLGSLGRGQGAPLRTI
jgi:hypothetical protein